jgi:hypothetical protein
MTDSMPFEAVKIAMAQTRDGVKITMVIHPHDDPDAMAELFKEPVGSRYMMALVRMDDENKPVPRHKTPGQNAVIDCAALCRNQNFHRWLWSNGFMIRQTEDEAAAYVRVVCGISSRKELATDEKALLIFNEMRLRFSNWLSKGEQNNLIPHGG